MDYGKINKIFKVIWLAIVAITAAALAVIIAVQLPQVQTAIANKAMDTLSDMLDADIKVEKIHIRPFNTLIIKNISINDKASRYDVDTLFKAKYIIARFTFRSLFKNENIGISRVYIDDARMNLVIEESDNEKGSIDNLSRMFRLTPSHKEQPDRDIFMIRNVEIHGMTFSMKNFSETEYEHLGGINWSDLEVNEIYLKARQLGFKDRIMSGNLEKLSFTEKSGYTCKSITGKARVGKGKAIIEDLLLEDPWSEISIPLFTMSYSGNTDFSDFVNKVRLSADIADSHLSMNTISYFAGGFSSDMDIRLDGQVEGPVCNLDIKGLNIETSDRLVTGKLKGRLKGLPDMEKMTWNVSLDDIRFTTQGIENIIKNWSSGSSASLASYFPHTRFRLYGRLDGRMNNFRLNSRIYSQSGRISSNLNIRNLTNKFRATSIGGYLETENLNIGHMLGSSTIGECSIQTGLNATISEGKKTSSETKLDIDSLKISRLNLLGYDYSNIAAAGTLSTKEFDGKIICNDPNLNFLFQGLFTLSPKTNNAIYKFYANVGYADLNAMNIDRRGISRIRFSTTANFNKISRGDLIGNIAVKGIVLENSLGKHEIGDIEVSSHSNEEIYRMRLSSSFAEGSFVGNGSIYNFADDILNTTVKRELPALYTDSLSVYSGNRYDFSFKLHDSRNLMAYLLPGTYISEGTDLQIGIDTSGLMSATLQSQRIAFKENYLKDIELKLDNSNGSIGGELNCSTMNAASFTLLNNRMQIFASNNHLGIGLSYDNRTEKENRGELNAICGITRTEGDSLKYSFSLLPSNVYIDSQEWNIKRSDAQLSGKDFTIGNFEVKSGDQSIQIQGGISNERSDTLSLALDRFSLSILNSLMKKNIGINADVTGKMQLISPAEERGLIVDMICDSTKIADTDLGTVEIASSWNENFKRFDFNLHNTLLDRKNLEIDGNFSPRLGRLETRMKLDSLGIAYFQPFAADIFSEMDGTVSGEFSAEGPLNALSLASRNARFNDAVLRIGYTNVPYSVNGDFHIDEYGVYFDNVSLADRNDNIGSIQGNITYENFRNFRFDLKMDVNRMECLDLTEKDNDTFYGKLSATGNIGISGPIENMLMQVDAITAGRGQIHIPLSDYASAGTTNLLKFKEIEQIIEVDPYEEMMNRLKEHREMSSDFGIKLRVTATPEIEAFIEIDKASNNVLTGRGSGVIELDIRPSKEIFNINGNYTISGGNYKFVAMGIASRDFTIQDGSSIRFNGDIMESTLNIDALYKTKASLATLIADTTSVSTRRLVECGIKITDKISNPRLAFSINIPDLDPTVKSRVENALSTEDKIQKQFLWLIVSNNFLPDEQSGITNNSSVLYSNVSEIMSNQLNSILQKFDIPLDLGLNYQPNDKGNDLFDVAVSTQLFNNRVIVNGNIGNRQYNSSSTNSDVVGDLDIEIKLDRQGAFRLNIFSHSADEYTNYLDNSQRNGIGLTYQQEFNRFGEFLRKLFSGKKKREAMELEMQKQELNEPKTTIIIPRKEENE